MNCPWCNGKTRVVDTGANEDAIYRQRKCVVCGHEIYTVERESKDLEGRLGLYNTRYLKRRKRP